MFWWRVLAVCVGLSLGPLVEWYFPLLAQGFDTWTIARASAISMGGYLVAILGMNWLERRLYPDDFRDSRSETGYSRFRATESRFWP
ncbi:hypothetical protein RQP54_01235 [Curvibacter sp. APW13]|uniref:hypothetical protein n=1 Tax=Curvibacter sp. APW13 TaxID=3077236 RepID=UPI0028DF1102|nr:hypothetical protein [Curvibacter sp. APW13]MDT8989479.1 hypothetical protein [Curvibacter sp. APW13]